MPPATSAGGRRGRGASVSAAMGLWKYQIEKLNHSAAEPQPNTFTTEGTEIAEKLDIKTNKIVNIANACYKMLAKISRLCNRVVQRAQSTQR
jgi:hypothetical protein